MKFVSLLTTQDETPNENKFKTYFTQSPIFVNEQSGSDVSVASLIYIGFYLFL